MLTAAAIGLAVYGIYSAGIGIMPLFGGASIDWWASVGLVLLGLILVVSAPLVRVRFPGGIALAAGALLALQALSLHNDYHFYGRIVVPFQAARATFSALLVLLAAAGRYEPDPLPADDAWKGAGEGRPGGPSPTR